MKLRNENWIYSVFSRRLYFGGGINNLRFCSNLGNLEKRFIPKTSFDIHQNQKADTYTICSSCGQKQKGNKRIPKEIRIESSTSVERAYSEEFLKGIQESNLILQGDSILFSAESGSEVVLIPNYFPKNQNLIFDSGNSISIRRLNYTDFEFTIEYNEKEFSGKASPYPMFYLGMETLVFLDGECTITRYYITETDKPCLKYIGSGNQNLAEENPVEVYAFVSVSKVRCQNQLNGLTNKK